MASPKLNADITLTPLCDLHVTIDIPSTPEQPITSQLNREEESQVLEPESSSRDEITDPTDMVDETRAPQGRRPVLGPRIEALIAQFENVDVTGGAADSNVLDENQAHDEGCITGCSGCPKDDDCAASARDSNQTAAPCNDNITSIVTSSFESTNTNFTNSSGREADTDFAISVGSLSTPTVEDTEPFPDYHDSCENNPPSPVDKEHEEAYNYAIAKVVEEVIRFQEVDSSITSLPDFSSTMLAAAALRRRAQTTPTPGSGSSSTANTPKAKIPTSRAEAAETNAKYEKRNDDDHVPDVTRRLKILLDDETVGAKTREQFSFMTQMVLRMRHILFEQEPQPVKPENFMMLEEVYLEVKDLASQMLRYISGLDIWMNELNDVGDRVMFVLEEIHKDKKISPVIRYRNLVAVVRSNIRPPRTSEEYLLATFFDFYDQYVYSRFISIRNRQIILEEGMSEDRIQASRILVAIWDVLNRVIENYEKYIKLMIAIRSRFIQPTVDEIYASPELWGYSHKRRDEILNADGLEQENAAQTSQPQTPEQAGQGLGQSGATGERVDYAGEIRKQMKQPALNM